MPILGNLLAIKKHSQDVRRFNIEKLSGLMYKTKFFDKEADNVLLIGGWQDFDFLVDRIARVISHKYNISVASMPGEDGTSSLRKIGMQPTLEKFAGYYYSFIKLTYLNQPIKIVCFDVGLPILAAMFEHHPEVQRQVTDVIVVDPYTGYQQLNLSRKELKIAYTLCWLGGKLPSPFPRLFFGLLRNSKLGTITGFRKLSLGSKISNRLYLMADLLSLDLSTYHIPARIKIIFSRQQQINLPSNFRNADIITLQKSSNQAELVNKILQLI